MSRFANLVGVLVAASMLAFSAARAEPVAAADQGAIKALIESQIAAFQRDDGAAAYGMASPGIHDIFPTVDTFMAMVREGYMPVYRPRSVVFGAIVATGAGAMQKVLVTGPDGVVYTAIYSLERQPDGGWLISGCTLVKPSGPTI